MRRKVTISLDDQNPVELKILDKLDSLGRGKKQEFLRTIMSCGYSLIYEGVAREDAMFAGMDPATQIMINKLAKKEAAKLISLGRQPTEDIYSAPHPTPSPPQQPKTLGRSFDDSSLDHFGGIGNTERKESGHEVRATPMPSKATKDSAAKQKGGVSIINPLDRLRQMSAQKNASRDDESI